MKRIAPLTVLIILGIMVSCIDKDYDLSQIETDGITVGNDQSEFSLPVATIHFTSRNICNQAEEGEISLKKIYDEVDIWLPATLTEGKEFVEISRLLGNQQFDQVYFDKLIHDINEEITKIEQKRELIALHIATHYRNRFINLITEFDIPNENVIATSLENATDQEAAQIIAELIMEYSEQTKQVVAEIFTVFLTKLSLVDIHTTVPKLNISSDVRDMILDNLDDSSVDNPINCLYIYGTAANQFPFEFEIIPSIEDADIDFGTIIVNQGTADINPIRIMRNDMEALLDGFTIKVPISTLRYYPHKEFTDDTEFNITLKIRKTGALKL
jgi:hypothetical protein